MDDIGAPGSWLGHIEANGLHFALLPGKQFFEIRSRVDGVGSVRWFDGLAEVTGPEDMLVESEREVPSFEVDQFACLEEGGMEDGPVGI